MNFFARLPGQIRMGGCGEEYIMKSIFLAHIGLPVHAGGMWGFVALILLILFVTLVVAEGSSKGKDK
jgi:hypothetical protein